MLGFCRRHNSSYRGRSTRSDQIGISSAESTIFAWCYPSPISLPMTLLSLQHARLISSLASDVACLRGCSIPYLPPTPGSDPLNMGKCSTNYGHLSSLLKQTPNEQANMSSTASEFGSYCRVDANKTFPHLANAMQTELVLVCLWSISNPC